jgi:hypothetical protein
MSLAVLSGFALIFASGQIANVAMHLVRHTSLTTTTQYMRVVEERMRDAVENLGGGFGGDSKAATGHKMSDLAEFAKMRELAKILENVDF